MNFRILPIALLTSTLFLPTNSVSANSSNWSINQDQTSVFEVIRPKPPGATRQWMRFWFISHGLMETGRHVAVGLRGQTFPGLAPTGRGITIGHTNGNLYETDPYGESQLYLFPERIHGGCLANDPNGVPGWPPMAGARPGQSQVEIFYPSGNRLYLYSCAPQLPWTPLPDRTKGLQDGQWYRYTIEVTDAGQVRFQIEDTAGNILGNSVVEDGWNPNAIDGVSQWIGISDGYSVVDGVTYGYPQSICISAYCDAPLYEPYWSVNITQIEGGWN